MFRLDSVLTPGRVYRRGQLGKSFPAVDRNLKNLVKLGALKKLAGGLYYKPQRNAFGEAPPEDRDVVRAFLKTDDFLLTSNSHYTTLGLGLTQLYGYSVVYNHKRSGDFMLGGKRFQFRVVPAFPRELSPEFLLVDLLNNLKRLPDETERVVRNLPSRLSSFDRDTLRLHLEHYGTARARRLLGQVDAALLS